MAGKPLGAGIGPIPCADAVGPQPGVQLHARRAGQCGPRGGQLRKAVRRIAVFYIFLSPIKLGHQVIHRPLPQPAGRVAVLQGVVLLRVARRGCAEPHAVPPGRGVAKLHQGVHVLPPPVVLRPCAAAGRVVRRVKGRVGGGVKIVVKVDAVHSVPCAQLPHPVGNVLPHVRAGGVEIRAGVGVPDPVRVQPRRACAAQRRGLPGLDAVRVDPGFQL